MTGKKASHKLCDTTGNKRPTPIKFNNIAPEMKGCMYIEIGVDGQLESRNEFYSKSDSLSHQLLSNLGTATQ